MDKKILLKMMIILLILLAILLITKLYMMQKNNNLNQNIKSSNTLVANSQTSSYNPDELYTDFNFYYITVMDSDYSTWDSNDPNYNYNNILKEVSYKRYVYKNDVWVLAKGQKNNPFFQQTGNGIIVNSEYYYIPIYELEIGKNKVVVTEISNGGTEKNKEFIINKNASDYDKMYKTEYVPHTDELTLTPYQKILSFNMNDTPDILLTGSFYTNSSIQNISWKRYAYQKSSNSWQIIPESMSNNVFYKAEGNAYIFDKFWAIDLMNIYFEGEKIEITAVDSSGQNVTQTIYLNNTSQPVNYNSQNHENRIVMDKATKFINNEVLIVFKDNVSSKRCEEIIAEIDGKIISAIGIVKEYDVQVNYTFNTLSEINNYSNMLKDAYEEIDEVGPNRIIDASYDIEK